MKWNVSNNGCITISHGDVEFAGGFPAFDYAQIKASAVHVQHGQNETTVRYVLDELQIELVLRDADGMCSLETTLLGNCRLPRMFYPLAGLTVQGANRFFKQGFGFGGPSGFVEINDATASGSHESYLTTGFIDAEDHTIVFGATAHRDFLNRNTIYSRTHKNGLVENISNKHVLFLEIGFSTENTKLDGTLALPTLYFLTGNKPYETFEGFAKLQATQNGVAPLKKPSFHYCSWYHKGCYFSEQDLVELLAGFDTIQPRVPLQAIQIDDGYCPAAGDWLLPTSLWPDTLKSAFEKILAKGYNAGVWVAPFMVGSRSQIAKEHPDWLLKGLDGNTIVEWTCVDGGAQNSAHCDEETYILDSSHPEAFEYLRLVFRTMRSWGATLYKTDFMDWGYRDSTTCQRFTPGKTSARYFSDVIEMIRSEIGEESFWLACISPFQPFIGLADGMRIANDLTCIWSDGAARHHVCESTADQYFNNILWQNDPDVTYVRDVVTKFSEDETRLVAIWNALLGGIVCTSDPLHRISAARLDLWRFLAPSQSHGKAGVLNWDKPGLKNCLIRQYPDGWGVYLINLDDVKRDFYLDLFATLATGATDFFVYEWDEKNLTPLENTKSLCGTLSPHSGKLFFMSQTSVRKGTHYSLQGLMTPKSYT